MFGFDGGRYALHAMRQRLWRHPSVAGPEKPGLLRVAGATCSQTTTTCLP